MLAWVGENAKFVLDPTGATGFQRSMTGVVHPSQLIQSWGRDELGGLAQFLSFYGNAQGRFNIGGAAEMRQTVGDAAQHPVHQLQDSKELLDELSEVTQKIFGTGLTLDSLGRTIRLRVGSIAQESPRIDDIPLEYREAMAALRPLDEQGDGMRSLLGQLLPVVTATYKLIVIDEPEAFLHPPQAHALGAELGRLAVASGVQILVATHDRNLLTGLLGSGVDVSVVRLTRDEGPSKASQLDSRQLRELWNDPVLKYTNVLDGLFHRLVVLAEAEGDCAFLSAALDCPGRAEGKLPRNEILFVPTGGKDGMPKVASALTAVKVPVVAAPDLDMLNDMGRLRALVESLGAKWTIDLQNAWELATSDIRSARERAKVGHVLDAISTALADYRADDYRDEFRDVVLAQLRTNGSPWEPVKAYGMGAFKGAAWTHATALVSALEQIGIVLVQEGELERLAPEISNRKGAGWLQGALTAGAQCNEKTQRHVTRIIESGELAMRR